MKFFTILVKIIFILKDGTIQREYSNTAISKVQLPDDFLNLIHIGRPPAYDLNQKNEGEGQSRRFTISISGHLTDFNLWNKILTVKEMVRWTRER